MVVFPILALVVSAACAAVLGYDTWRRPKPDRVVWTVAFAVFAVAAGAEVVGSLAEWNEPLVRVYYLTGAVLVVGYLALGEGYLLARSRIERWAPGLTILVTALAATLVIDAPIDTTQLADHGWEALERGPALVALTVAINSIGTVVLVGGALYSARRFRQLGIMRNRMIGCLLIAVGTLVVASGGTLTRFGQREFLYIAMSIGVAIIFAGVLQTRRSDAPAESGQVAAGQSGAGEPSGPRLISLPEARHLDQGISYIESHLLTLDGQAIEAACEIWSVSRQDVERFSRDQAKVVWRLRSRLPAKAHPQFDALAPATRLQLAELYFDVFVAADDVAQSG
jgi:hypothetical protein